MNALDYKTDKLSKAPEVNVAYLSNLNRLGKHRIWIAQPHCRGPHLPNGLAESNAITVTVVK